MKLQASPVKLGTKDRSVEVGGFVLTETLRPPGLVIPSHYHDRTNVSFVLQGAFVETVGREPFELRPGSVVLRPAGETHRNQYGAEPARCLIIEVGPERLRSIREHSDLLDRTAHLRDNVMSNLALRIHREFRLMDGASLLAIESLILEMMARAVRQSPGDFPKKEPRCLREARAFIHAHFTEPIGLSRLAQITGVHPSHLAKMFRSRHRCTLGEYVRRLRLDYAERELALSDKPVSEIALAAGFYDQSHFTNAFKLSCGVTPSEFRGLQRNRKNFTKG